MFKKLFVSLLIGVAVALTYFVFEGAVAAGLEFFWEDLADTNDKRLLIIPIILVMSLVYFYLRHRWQHDAEHKETGLLGDTPKPTIKNFIQILIIGFFSLVAGVSLGPEAVLVPACIIAGLLVAKSFGEKKDIKAYGDIGFIALFAAFFNSFYGALLGLILLRQINKKDLEFSEIFLIILATAGTVMTLRLLDTKSYFDFPPHEWAIQLENIVVYTLLFVIGILCTQALAKIESLTEPLIAHARKTTWWKHAIIASAGLSILYLLGGSLVQFTGNESIEPMLNDATTLGAGSLLWLAVVKLGAISWSKTIGYTGGMIFPMVFVSAVFSAIALQLDQDISIIVGMLCVLFGAIYINRKINVLF